MTAPFWATAGPGDFGGNVDTPAMLGHISRGLAPVLDTGGVIVDLGCGPGRLLFPMAATHDRSVTFVGVEPVAEVRALAPPQPPNVSVMQGDAERMPFIDETVDGVWCVLVWQHLPLDVVRASCVEVARVLRPGGRFVVQWVTNGDPPTDLHHPHRTDDVFDAVTDAGLVTLAVEQDRRVDEWAWLTAERP